VRFLKQADVNEATEMTDVANNTLPIAENTPVEAADRRE
jgi:hypothetical protein